jgi:hypothetical protein
MNTTIDKIAWIQLEFGRVLSTRSHGKSTRSSGSPTLIAPASHPPG